MKSRLTFSRFALSLVLSTQNGLAESITMFDTDILRARGIPTSVATYLQSTSRFPPGINHPTLIVNGNQRGTVSVTFNDQGILCIDTHFLKIAGILIPKSKKSITVKNKICQSLPIGIDVKLYPGYNRIELLVPPQLIDNSTPETLYVNGGSAALFNYNLYITGNNNFNHKFHTFYANTESGFNFNNWIVRSYDFYSSQYNNSKFKHQNAWIQRTFPSFKSTIQVGQLTLNSPLFSISAFNGIQIIPEDALLKIENGVRVTGITPSAARIEVRQSGVLIYSTLAPAGTFVLNNLPLNNFSEDLEVTVIENNGLRRRFTVPAASFLFNFIPIQQNWTFAAGQLRDIKFGSSNNLKSHGFITASFPIRTLYTNITTGLILAQRYTSVGLNAKTSLWKGSSTYLHLLASRDTRTKTHGIITQAGHSIAIGDTLLATFNTAFYTLGFRYLTDNPQSNALRYNLQRRLYSASLRWSNDTLGYFSFGLARTERFNNTFENYPMLSWSRNIGLANISFSMSPRNSEHVNNMYYLNVSFPMNKINTNFAVSKEGHYTRASTNINQQLNDTVGYSVGISTINNKYYNFNSSVNLQSRYTSLYGNYSYNGHDSHSWSASMKGSIIHDGQSLLFSSYNTRDTFGIVNVTGLNNARIQTPSGMILTNKKGRAAVPSVIPYTNSRVELITQGLPRNIEINNASSIIKAARGSVSNFNLKVKQQRKILLQVKDSYGNSLDQGMTVLDKYGNYLSITGADGDIYLDIKYLGNGVLIEGNNGRRCTLNFIINKKQLKYDEPYEIVPAICQ
ncbi:MAG: fimbria/pilus outer membrane usher protein [Arsenophonus sp. ET-YP4-MAG3]